MRDIRVWLLFVLAAAAGLCAGAYFSLQVGSVRGANIAPAWTETVTRPFEPTIDQAKAAARSAEDTTPATLAVLGLLAGVAAFFFGLARRGFAAALAWFVGVVLLFAVAWPLAVICIVAITVFGLIGLILSPSRRARRA